MLCDTINFDIIDDLSWNHVDHFYILYKRIRSIHSHNVYKFKERSNEKDEIENVFNCIFCKLHFKICLIYVSLGAHLRFCYNLTILGHILKIFKDPQATNL